MKYLNFMRDITGPKISSFAISISSYEKENNRHERINNLKESDIVSKTVYACLP